MQRSIGTKRGAALVLVVFFLAALAAPRAHANPPAPDPSDPGIGKVVKGSPSTAKEIDLPNPKEVARIRARKALLAEGKPARASALATTGSDRVLVILVEFGGPDVIPWTNGTSAWDPLGDPDPNESTGVAGDCSKIATKLGISDTLPHNFAYAGPLHNQIERPRSATDRSGTSIWTTDFSAQWFKDFMFGNGVVINYARQDASTVNEDFTGASVRKYYEDMSGGAYTIAGDVIGWVKVPHSSFWYDADQCPGARSGLSVARGVIPGAGNARQLVKDAVDAVAAISNTIPGFTWANYDKDGDKVIDRLWIVHAGYGEEDSTTLLRTWDDPATPTVNEKRTDYGEGAVWSHSSQVTPAYEIVDPTSGTPTPTGYFVGPYIMMPENGGISVFSHEYGHNLGADDLYAYGNGETSAGFWTLMADDWTGYPIGFLPPALDPRHLDEWGWLDPLVVTDPTQTYDVTIGQASSFPGGAGVYRGAKIPLPDGQAPLPIQPNGTGYWWGGKKDLSNGKMTLTSPLAIPAGSPASLSFSLVWDIENEWDFLWVQASKDGGTTWTTLTNPDTTCTHVEGWIGALYGFPDDLCGNSIGGFTSYNPEWPAYRSESMDLSAFAGEQVLLRFWYMTDWGTTYTGAFLDNITVTSGSSAIFSDNGDAGGGAWTYEDPWIHSLGYMSFKHAYYLQWRNSAANGGYDRTLGETRWAAGPVDSGLIVWYENELYNDNEIFNYLTDYPGWGPKGKMLVVDSHPDPLRDPYWVAYGYNNEGGNVGSRIQMRDAPFTPGPTLPITMEPQYGYIYEETLFPARTPVSVFDDALGYYPGAEYVSRGPGYVPPSYRWVTAAWDSSVVVPSSVFYGIKAPGYVGTGGTSDQEFRYSCSRAESTGRLSCYYYGVGAGLGYDGGDGNPGTGGGSYGVKVEVISQAADGTWGTVRIGFDRPPVASDQTLLLPKNTPSPITLAVTDPEGKALTVTVVTPPANGALTGTAPYLTYTPTADYEGADSFTYRASDGHANSRVATVAIRVKASLFAKFKSEGGRDGWVLESSERSGKGGTKNSAAPVLIVGDDEENREYRSLLSFPTGTLPDNAVVYKVQLRVRRAGITGANPFTSSNPLLADIRSLRFGTSATLQIGDFQATAGKSTAGTFGRLPAAGWYSATLARGAFGSVNRSGTTQFRLRFRRDDDNDHKADYITLFSGNAAASFRPELLVYYLVP